MFKKCKLHSIQLNPRKLMAKKLRQQEAAVAGVDVKVVIDGHDDPVATAFFKVALVIRFVVFSIYGK